jgi:hypothetical protein
MLLRIIWVARKVTHPLREKGATIGGFLPSTNWLIDFNSFQFWIKKGSHECEPFHFI